MQSRMLRAPVIPSGRVSQNLSTDAPPTGHRRRHGHSADVFQKMDDGNVHLVIVVSQESELKRRPLHLVTQRDVLKVICNGMGMGPM